MTTLFTRKPAAIMFTDIANFTQTMSANEDAALKMVHKKRSILKPLIGKNHGTFVKEIGDGTLSYFSSSSDAASCAVKLQQETFDDSGLNIRVGIHCGQVVFEEMDVFGDVVNIAARLESIAPVGGVCVSKDVYDELMINRGFSGVSLGLQQLKGVGRLVNAFALEANNIKPPDLEKYFKNQVKAHSEDEVPSIAVLPIENKGKEEDAFYAYGIWADLIDDLSRSGKIRVASKKDIEELSTETSSLIEIAQELNVRYIASGVLWKHEDMFQLSIEVNDTKENSVLWSDRWQEEWQELTKIKGKLAEGLLSILNITSNANNLPYSSQANTEAYEYYLKGKYKYENRQNVEDTEIARGLLQRAIQMDDTLLQAKNKLGDLFNNSGDLSKAKNIYERALEQALDVDDEPGQALTLDNLCSVYSASDYNKALDFGFRSLEISKKLDDKKSIGDSLLSIGVIYFRKRDYSEMENYFKLSFKMREEIDDKKALGQSLLSIGLIYIRKREYKKALEYSNQALEINRKLNSKDGMNNALSFIGIIYGALGDYDNAMDCDKKTLEINRELGDKPSIASSESSIGNVYASIGDNDEALKYYARSYEITKELGDMKTLVGTSMSIGSIYYRKKEYKKALEHLEASLNNAMSEGDDDSPFLLEIKTLLFLTRRQLGKPYDAKEVLSLIDDLEQMFYGLRFHIYELVGETMYLESAYKVIQDKVSGMEHALKVKFLNYPIPKAIVEAWEKLK